MIIAGEIFAIDCGEKEIIFHISTDNGPVACYAAAEYYEAAIRLCYKYKYSIKLMGDYIGVNTYRSGDKQEVLFKICYLEQILFPEDAKFLLTGAL